MMLPMDFERMGLLLIKRGDPKRNHNDERVFASHFGTDPDTCADAWSLLISSDYVQDHDNNPKPKHLFFGLYSLKINKSEHVSCKFFQVDEKTYRKWSWFIIDSLSQLQFRVIKWNRRFVNAPRLWRQLTSVDGTDFRIQEPFPFSSKWFSHKFKGPGVRYEVVISIYNGSIVHINGPFPCGAFPDIRIARSELIHKLVHGERVEADNGYGGESRYITIARNDGGSASRHEMKSAIRARHENVNSRFKKWSKLDDKFRFGVSKHGNVFTAVAVLTELEIRNGHLIYDVPYNT